MLKNKQIIPEFSGPMPAINWLKEQGYQIEFSLENEYVQDKDKTLSLYPKDFNIDHTFRFSGPTNPANEVILYAISSNDKKHKGIIFNAYGVFADQLSSEMIDKISQI